MSNPATPHGTALDLGWCIVRPITAEAGLRINRTRTYPRIEATMAAHAGLSRSQFKRLSPERRRELYLAHLWMMRQFDPPMVGTPIIA